MTYRTVAIILIGDVRECDIINHIPKWFQNFDVYIGSYKKHESYTSRIGKSNYSVLIDPEKNLCYPAGLSKSDMQSGMLQWLHLNNVIKTYKDSLLTYDVLFKFRFDICIQNCSDYDKLIHKCASSAEENTIYNHTDICFYGKANTFITSFDSFYDEIIRETHEHW